MDFTLNSGSKVNLFTGIEMGIGTWAWGDRLFWGFGDGYTEKEIEESFYECINHGIRFFDTAEVYGQGRSETILGRLIKESNSDVLVASKMMPYPWRVGKGTLRRALIRSLSRLGLTRMNLYQMHWPLRPVDVSTWMNRMADLHEEGLIDFVGVSNYNLEQTRVAHETLKKRGLLLASNQVEYHLLERRIETNGLMSYCNNEGIKVIAYSPLAMGMLTGKYTPQHPPHGIRAGQYNRSFLEKIQPLLRLMLRIGSEHDGKTPAQVALNWVIRKGAIPIPGVKNINQVTQNLGALGWELSMEEVSILDEFSSKVTKSGVKP